MMTPRLVVAAIFLLLAIVSGLRWPTAPAAPQISISATETSAQHQARYTAWLQRHNALRASASTLGARADKQ